MRGNRSLRYLFMDEAGTSAPEPVTVVVALIADADNHVMSAEALVLEILAGVPPQHKEVLYFTRPKFSVMQNIKLIGP